ncbi:hypothetical protein [Hydrogenophaga sp. OTU3427]|uniref:hypothetical protein n=1 Tax=Hydrogenophaga sp. OTU3427 TaxID=3043856 RepID=UPI00313E7BE6
MATLFVLNVEEFRPLIEQARLQTAVTVSAGPRGYTRITTAGELSFNRKALGFKPAVWYGALTGGLVGHVAEFSRDNLRITGDVA